MHGGNGFGVRNTEGEMLLEFAHAMDLAVANTWFMEEEAKKVTYESGGNKSVVDYILVRKGERAMVRDAKVIPREECLSQHKLLVGLVEFRKHPRKRKEKFVGKCRVWKLKDPVVKSDFQDNVQVRAIERSEGVVESVWKGLKNCLLMTAENVCGKTKGPPNTRKRGGGIAK